MNIDGAPGCTIFFSELDQWTLFQLVSILVMIVMALIRVHTPKTGFQSTVRTVFVHVRAERDDMKSANAIFA